MVSLHRNYLRKDRLYGYIFVLPAAVYMLVFIGYPIVSNILLSFQNVDVMTIKNKVRQFIGFNNYHTLFSKGIIGITLLNTLVYTSWCLLFQFLFGFLLALFFNSGFTGSGPIMGILIITWIMPLTVTALVFKFMLSQDNGVINDILQFLGLIHEPVGWLVNQKTALWGLIIANTWVGIPFNMILLTTGLSSIPGEVYESASIDGSGPMRSFIHITLPLLRPAIFSVLVLGFIFTFKVFDLVFVMTNGGPVNSTEVLSTYAYRLSFKQYNFSQGAAAANILFLSLALIGAVYLTMIKDNEAI